jgi:hypothetical protein
MLGLALAVRLPKTEANLAKSTYIYAAMAAISAPPENLKNFGSCDDGRRKVRDRLPSPEFAYSPPVSRWRLVPH